MATRDVVVNLTLDPRFARLLTRQDDLQAFLLGRRVADLDFKELADFIRVQAFALNAEVHEAVDETHWKPWATPPEGEGVVISKNRYTGELADVFIFLMNLMLAGDVTMNELAEAVNVKQDKNLGRWMKGYDAKSTKCKGCRRAFDDKDVTCYPSTMSGEELVLAFCSERERFIDSEGNPVT